MRIIREGACVKGLLFLAGLTPGSCDDGPACPQVFLWGRQPVLQGYDLTTADRSRLELSPAITALRLPTELLHRGITEARRINADEALWAATPSVPPAIIEQDAENSVVQGNGLPAELAAFLTIPTGELAVLVALAALQAGLAHAGRN